MLPALEGDATLHLQLSYLLSALLRPSVLPLSVAACGCSKEGAGGARDAGAGAGTAAGAGPSWC